MVWSTSLFSILYHKDVNETLLLMFQKGKQDRTTDSNTRILKTLFSKIQYCELFLLCITVFEYNEEDYWNPSGHSTKLNVIKQINKLRRAILWAALREKSVRIRSSSGPYFPAFELNTERYEESLRIQSECGKIRARKTPNTDTFHVVWFIWEVSFSLTQTGHFDKTPLV